MRSKGSRGLTAGTLAGLLGCGQRFSREGQLASYAGVAPLEASSGGVVRHRLDRIGNRHRNAVSATAGDPSVDATRPRSSVA